MTPPHDSEGRTRKRLINPKLKAAGWRVVKYEPVQLKHMLRPVVALRNSGQKAVVEASCSSTNVPHYVPH
jgi:hypothetical protein